MMMGFLCGHFGIFSSLFVSNREWTRMDSQHVNFDEFCRQRGYYDYSSRINQYYNYMNEVLWFEKSYRCSFYMIIISLVLTSLTACLLRNKKTIRKSQQQLYYVSTGLVYCLFNAIGQYNYHSDLLKQMLPMLGILVILLMAQILNLHHNYVQINVKDSLLLISCACFILNGILSIFYYSIPRHIIYCEFGLSYLIYYLTKLAQQLGQQNEQRQVMTPEAPEEIPECQLKLVKTQYLILKKSHSCILASVLLLLLLVPFLGVWTMIITALLAINILIDTKVMNEHAENSKDYYLAVLILYADIISPLKNIKNLFKREPVSL